MSRKFRPLVLTQKVDQAVPVRNAEDLMQTGASQITIDQGHAPSRLRHRKSQITNHGGLSFARAGTCNYESSGLRCVARREQERSQNRSKGIRNRRQLASRSGN